MEETVKQSLRKMWSKRVAAWQKSGQSAREYATQLGVHPQTLYSWKHKLAREESSEKESHAPVAFVEVLTDSALSPPQTGAFELHLEGGHCITVPAHFDPVSLRRLLDVMERRA